MKQHLYWSGHIALNAPDLIAKAIPLAVSSRTWAQPGDQQILVCTYHKALTVFLNRVFRVFASVTGRSFAKGGGRHLDYSADVLFDFMSVPKWAELRREFVGLHVTRDPRDMLVSSAFYHRHSAEAWLHKPYERFEGLTYQQKVNSLETIEEQLLFEIAEEGGVTIANMVAWDYDRPQVAEARYDELVGPEAAGNFRQAIDAWPLKPAEKELLEAIFRYFSLGGPGTRTNHVRNAKSGQWREHFTPRVEAAFNERFPGAIEKLGYEPT